MCFVDLEKAFDCVPHGILWEVLWEYGAHGPLLRAVRSLYNRSRSLVRIASYDVVLLAPSSLDLQHALGCFAAECEAAGMRVSTSKSEAMVLNRKKVACTLQVGGEVLPQVEEFKYLGVLFTSEGRMDHEIDRWIGAAAAVMRSMYRSVVVKKELSRKAKLSIYQSIYVPTLTYGHEPWVMTERVRSRIQVAEMSFLRRVAGRSLRDRVRSSVTQEELGVEPLLLHIERGQLRWLGHLFRMPPGRLPGEVFRACPTGKRPRGRPRTRWRDYVSRLAWEHLGVPPEELEEVSGEREEGAGVTSFLERMKENPLGLQEILRLGAYFVKSLYLRFHNAPETTVRDDGAARWHLKKNAPGSVHLDYYRIQVSIPRHVSGIEEILEVFLPPSDNIPSQGQQLSTSTVNSVGRELLTPSEVPNRLPELASPNSSQTQVFASETTTAAVCLACRYVSAAIQSPPSQPGSIELLLRLDGIPYFQCPLLCSGIATTTGTRDLMATAPDGCINNGGREHGPLRLNVPNLPRDLVETLPEVGVEDPPNRGISKTFPTDPHNTFGLAKSVRHPPP
ncbi:hypothetical protein QTP86_013330 [Hemibagrus guttatus]|nr:hypothetical protein QTP86_013330 [Hemibagrus guttatus]